MKCPNCNVEITPGKTRCHRCGQVVDIDDVKGRIFWNIQSGQVARVINEKEFEAYGNIKGILISEGTTAYIRANGHTIASISGGYYDLTEQSQPGMIKRAWQVILNLFKSRRKKIEEEQGPLSGEELYIRQQQLIWENAKKGASFSVVILLNQGFPVMIGAKQPTLDDYKNFKPMRIQTRYIEMGLGVNAYFKIADQERFILHYLTTRQVMNTALIVDEISDSIRVILQDALYDVELSSNRIPEEMCRMLKERINAVAAENFFGLSILRIVEISAESADLARFAKLSSELYLSEKELDYLHRTNDFKNRLADAANAQAIFRAKTDLERDKQLEAINRDRLLSEEELELFKHFLKNEAIVRTATNDDERDGALFEIAKTKLLREEEVRTLRHQVISNEYQRGAALEMMQLRDKIEFEKVRLEGQYDQAVLAAKKEIEVQAAYDSYNDSRFNEKLKQQIAVANANLDLEQQQRDMQYKDQERYDELRRKNEEQRRQWDREDDAQQHQQFKEILEMKQKGKQAEMDHESRMFEQAAHLTPEQIALMKGGSAASEAFFNVEAEKKAQERVEAARREAQERADAKQASLEAEMRDERRRREMSDDKKWEMMDRLANNMVNAMGGIQYRQNEERERQMRERDERILRQESRIDTAYDRAMDYTTRPQQPVGYPPMPQQPGVYPQMPQQPMPQQPMAQPTSYQSAAPQPAASKIKCPVCDELNEPGTKNCYNCAAPLG